MKKRSIALFLVLAMMLAALSGCAKTAEQEQSEAPAVSTSEDNEAETTVPEETEREDITLTILMHGGATASGIQDDPVTKAIQEKLGITMDVISTNGMDITANLNALIASDDLPDIVVAVTPDQGKLLLDADAIIPLDDLIAEYGGDIAESNLAQTGMYLNREYIYKTEDGKNYFIPVLSGENYIAGFPQVAPYIRWDIYEKIGMPEVEDMDGLLDVLKQMQDAYPETEDGRTVYAISGSLADGAWNNWSLTAIEAAIGMRRVHTSGLAYLSTADPTKMVNGFEGENAPVWRLFRFFNKAYQMGILDPESATMKHDQFNEKISAGQVLYTPFKAAGAVIENDAEKYFLPVPFENFENDSFTCSYSNAAGQFNYAISKNCEYPERAMELLNYIWTSEGAYLFANGSLQGENWDVVDGEAQLLETYVQGRNDGSIAAPLFSNFIGQYIDPETNQPYNLTSSDTYFENYLSDEHTKAYCEKYGVQSPIENFTKAEHHLWDTAFQMAMPTLEGEMKDIGDRLKEYALTNLTKMVFAETDEEFEQMRQKFMEDINSMGAPELYAYMEEVYNSQVAAIYDYLK